MSRLYFSSVSGEAELAGPERHWLFHVALGPAAAAWDLDNSLDKLEQCSQIIGMIKEYNSRGERDYLHKYLDDAKAWTGRVWENEPLRQLQQSLAIRVSRSSVVSETTFVVGERELGGINVSFNTAIACGGGAVQIAAKLAGWDWCLIEGEDRAWMADIIDHGVRHGPFRGSMQPMDEHRGIEDMGWGKVAEFLRSNDNEAVVTHHSSGSSFPDSDIAGWSPGEMPKDWHPDYFVGPEDHEWVTYTDEDKAGCWSDHSYDLWAENSTEQQWAMALDGLRVKRPWAQLSPDLLGSVYFGPPVTVYDLLAPDRDARVERAFTKMMPGAA